MKAFREAVENRDLEAVAGLLADDVRFTSPVAFKPYDGAPVTAAILRAVIRVLPDLHYVREITAPDERDHALLFEATLGGRTINGCDFIQVDDEGRIRDLMVMVRPLSAATALSEAMAAEFPQILEEAAGGATTAPGA